MLVNAVYFEKLLKTTWFMYLFWNVEKCNDLLRSLFFLCYWTTLKGLNGPFFFITEVHFEKLLNQFGSYVFLQNGEQKSCLNVKTVFVVCRLKYVLNVLAHTCLRQCTSEWINERTSEEWLNEQINEWRNEWTSEWINERIIDWLNQLRIIH
jgi:hypothetical protein